MGELIPFPVDLHSTLREDLLALMRRNDPGGCVADKYVSGANEMARWLLRPGGAVRRLLDDNKGGAA